jgi:hypothetical protein
MKLDLTTAQGSTFEQTAFWETPPLVYKAITDITLSGPVRVQAPGHGLLNGYRAAVIEVEGTTELNATHTPFLDEEYHAVTVLDADNIEFNDLPAIDFTNYRTGGFLVYNTPKALAGFTARMTIKDKVGGTVLLALTSPSAIAIGTSSVVITVTATQTAALAVGRWVYDLELVSAGGVVTKLLTGLFKVTPEVTT